MNWFQRCVYWLVRPISWLLCRLLFRLHVTGAEHLPSAGAVLVAANHCSFLDPVVLGAATRRPISYLVTSEIYRLPWMRPLMWALGAIPVEQGRSDRGALDRAQAELGRGRVVGIFPEGGISRDGHLRRGHGGVALLALATGAPIVPVALVATHRALRRGSFRLRLVRVSVHFLPPQDPAAAARDAAGLSARKHIVAAVMRSIEHALPADQQPLVSSSSEERDSSAPS